MFFTGDVWQDGNSTLEGNSIVDLTTMLGLTQLMNQQILSQTENPSCIDLVFTDQPNLLLESGTRTSLDSYCNHEITHCRFNFKIPLPFERRCISNFPWEQHFSSSPDAN